MPSCAPSLAGGKWAPAGSASHGTVACSSEQLFQEWDYSAKCSPRCQWHVPGCLPISSSVARHCLAHQRDTPAWLVFVGDSQVRHLLKYAARWLGSPIGAAGVRTHSNNTRGSGTRDDWDHTTQEGVRLSYRFSGPDWSRFDRVRRNPAALEAFDEQTRKHRLIDAATAATATDSRQPDLLLFASSLWDVKCENIVKLASTVALSFQSGVPVVGWTLLPTYIGPLDRNGWPELAWNCEYEAAARINLSEAGPFRVLLDLKQIVAIESRPHLLRECPMLRRELYGLPAGDGVHWGVSVLDAWFQAAVLRALCHQV